MVLTDFVLEPFGAKIEPLVAAARLADAQGSGISGVWVYDHFSAMVATGGWSREPFTLLGAFAAATNRVTLGTLVANIYNRHPIHLAVAFNTLQALSGGRAICGVGSGAAPGSRFAVEHDALQIELDDGPTRRQRLIETIAVLRQTWSGETVDFDGATLQVAGAKNTVDNSPAPRLIVGASGPQTVLAAAHHADGVNIRVNDRLPSLVTLARANAVANDFEISVITKLDREHPHGGPTDEFVELGIDRRILAVPAPYDLGVLERVAAAAADG